jgi:hypothetical protein
MRRLVLAIPILAIALSGCLFNNTYQAGPNTSATPGLWHAWGYGDACYWERLSGFGGTLGEIIANDINTTGPRYVEIKPTDVGFNTDGCVWWRADDQFDQKFPPTAFGQFGDGDYRVGVEVPAGTYVSNNPQGCYWERLNGFGGELGNIIANSFSGIVTISPSDVGFSSDGCGIWTKIG